MSEHRAPTSAREALIDALKRQNPHETDEVIKLMNAAASALASSLPAQLRQMDAREALLREVRNHLVLAFEVPFPQHIPDTLVFLTVPMRRLFYRIDALLSASTRGK